MTKALILTDVQWSLVGCLHEEQLLVVVFFTHVRRPLFFFLTYEMTGVAMRNDGDTAREPYCVLTPGI